MQSGTIPVAVLGARMQCKITHYRGSKMQEIDDAFDAGYDSGYDDGLSNGIAVGMMVAAVMSLFIAWVMA